MVPAEGLEPSPGFVTALRFVSTDAATLVGQLRHAVELLATFEGFVDARIARAVDSAQLISLNLGWENVGAYRRALSSFEVKVAVVPLLSQALDEASAFEVLQVTDSHGIATARGALAADAGSVSLGWAAAERVEPEPS